MVLKSIVVGLSIFVASLRVSAHFTNLGSAQVVSARGDLGLDIFNGRVSRLGNCDHHVQWNSRTPGINGVGWSTPSLPV
jgi:hypothetical protein